VEGGAGEAGGGLGGVAGMRWKRLAWLRGDRTASFIVDWESEWASLWERVLRTQPFPDTTVRMDWDLEIDLL
jgi:hypothetical protein